MNFRDVSKLTQKTIGKEFFSSPLLVMNGFNVQAENDVNRYLQYFNLTF
jgi:hypothetical protein